MGHDIYAYKVSPEEAELASKKLLDKFDINDYRKWQSQVYAATFRRSAFDRFNSIIYRLLECEDLYSGVSGKGEYRDLTLDQFRRAYAALPYVLADGAPPVNVAAKQIKKALAAMLPEGDPVHVAVAPADPEHDTLDEERQFLYDAITWMETENRDTVKVYFG